MIKKLSLLIFLTVGFLFFSTEVSAQTKVRVRFAKGDSSTALKGKISGYRYIDYLVSAKSGQTMAVSLNSANLGCSFVIFHSNMENVEDAVSVTDFKKKLDTTDNYIVRVLLPRSAARRKEVADYALRITIK